MVFEQVEQLLAPRALERGLEIILRYAPGAPRHVIGDAGRIRQVVTNLVGNAIKFTLHGNVLIDVACLERTEEGSLVEFSIHDTGIGIATDKLRNLIREVHTG